MRLINKLSFKPEMTSKQVPRELSLMSCSCVILVDQW